MIHVENLCSLKTRDSLRSLLHVSGTWSVFKTFDFCKHEIPEGAYYTWVARDACSRPLISVSTRFLKAWAYYTWVARDPCSRPLFSVSFLTEVLDRYHKSWNWEFWSSSFKRFHFLISSQFMTNMQNAPPGLRWTNVKHLTGLGWWITVHEVVMFLVSKKCKTMGNGVYKGLYSCFNTKRNRRRSWRL